jgi:hypothetical protein
MKLSPCRQQALVAVAATLVSMLALLVGRETLHILSASSNVASEGLATTTVVRALSTAGDGRSAEGAGGQVRATVQPRVIHVHVISCA